ARTEKIVDVLAKVAKSPIWQKLNEGNPWQMGESIGITEEFARERTQKLQNVCLWCDEFFDKHCKGKLVEAE
ncbi:MAG TPA: radical SAM protein, partial [Microscillaceae bacterium]|nr:radical SAM protein [Microscillaceae bacterium]